MYILTLFYKNDLISLNDEVRGNQGAGKMPFGTKRDRNREHGLKK